MNRFAKKLMRKHRFAVYADFSISVAFADYERPD
jgi:hypothetical protein